MVLRDSHPFSYMLALGAGMAFSRLLELMMHDFALFAFSQLGAKTLTKSRGLFLE